MFNTYVVLEKLFKCASLATLKNVFREIQIIPKLLNRLNIGLPAVQSLDFFPALALFVTCYLSLGFSSKLVQSLYIV